MRYLWTLGLLLIIFTASSQDDKEAEQVKGVIHQILEMSVEEADTRLAELIVYRGEDKTRKWKDVYDAGNPKELERVKSIRTRIQKKIIPYKYEFVKFITEKESEGKWYVWELKLSKGDKVKKAYLAFLKINGEFALGDID